MHFYHFLVYHTRKKISNILTPFKIILYPSNIFATSYGFLLFYFLIYCHILRFFTDYQANFYFAFLFLFFVPIQTHLRHFKCFNYSNKYLHKDKQTRSNRFPFFLKCVFVINVFIYFILRYYFFYGSCFILRHYFIVCLILIYYFIVFIFIRYSLFFLSYPLIFLS